MRSFRSLTGAPYSFTPLPFVCFAFVATSGGQSQQAQQAQQEAIERYHAILRLKGQTAFNLALDEAKALAEDHPELHSVHRTIVDLYLAKNDSAGARRDFQARLERNPSDAFAYYGLGRVALHEGELDDAIENLERAIRLKPDFAPPYGPNGGLPEAYGVKKDLDAAIGYFQALTRSSPGSANAFSGLGWSYARSFRVDDAIRAFTASRELEPDHVGSLHGLVQSFSRTGRYQRSLELTGALRQAAARLGDLEASSYASMMEGTIAYFRGDYRTALGHLHESLRIAREIGDRAREAGSVNNLAAVYATAGELEKALEYFEMGLALARASGDAQAQIIALGNIGSVYKETHRFELALARYRDAAALARAAGAKGHESATLANMGEVFQQRGDLDEADRHYRDALQLAKEIQNHTIEAFAAGALGDLNRELGNDGAAIAYFERELASGEQTGEVQAQWEAHAGLGATYQKRGDRDKAIEHYAEAIAVYDAVRESLGIESLGSTFLEDKYEAYPSIVQLLAEEGALEEAFNYAEKFKAKGFLDILARGQTLFESQLPEELRLGLDAIRAELAEAHAARARERSNGVKDPSTRVTLDERIVEIELRQSALIDRIRNEHGAFYRLALSEPIGIDELQSEVLRDGKVLVEYVVGDEATSVFVVSRNALQYRALPLGRSELRERLSELSPLFAHRGSGATAHLFNSELVDFSLPPARVLHQALIDPVAEWLPEGSELVIVPDDFLFYLPFEGLVAESEGAEHRYDFSAATFLVERHAVSYAPSASSLDPRLRRTRRFAKGVLAVGNPTFDDWRSDLPALPSSETEVAAIAAAFDGYDNGVYTGESATESVIEREASDYGVLHFATHFSSDDTQPLYSRIELAASDVLHTYEIFDAELNAELAVLSACNTGLGRLRKGEGLIGVSRAFAYAGVPSIVFSLWSVDDEATAAIMESFYRHLRAGESKNRALRRAKLDYLKTAGDEEKDPFYWAPFVLSGAWEPLSLPAPRGPETARIWVVLGVLVAACAAGWFLVQRRPGHS